MKIRCLVLLLVASFAAPLLRAQDPKAPIDRFTLSNGSYPEVFANDTLRKIGSFVFNTVTGRAYRFGSNGKENDPELHDASGTSSDFGVRMYDPRAGRWLSLDPAASKFPGVSPYVFTDDSPIIYSDPTGQWSVSAHYRMTYKALREMGIRKQTAREIAHYASTYADGANNFMATLNAAGGLVNPLNLWKNESKYGSYEERKDSQSKTDVQKLSEHATRGEFERGKVSADEAVNRALYGGTYKDETGNDVHVTGAFEVLDEYRGVDLEKDLTADDAKRIGVALHTIEDVAAHHGAFWTEKKGQPEQHDMLHDMFGSQKEAKRALRAAIKEYFGKQKEK